MGLQNEYDYFVGADLGHWAGKWVAILENKVIASGDSFGDVAKAIEKERVKGRPLFARVPSKLAAIL